MKVELDKIRLGITAISEECHAGVLDSKNPALWKSKVNVHNDFLHAVITCWAGKKQIVNSLDGYKYTISVKKEKQ